MPFTRKKDKKVEVSFTNWILGGSLVSLTSTTSTDPSRLRSGAKRVIVTEFESDDDAVLIKSPQSQKADKKEIDKEKSKDAEQEGKGEKKDKSKGKGEKTEKCGKCGKKVVPCKEGCKGCDNKSKSKSESKGDGKKDGGEKFESEGKNGSENGWTKQQDAKIKEMKEDNKSWKDIALEVSASKKDVQNRYKELMNGGDGGQNKSDEKKDEGGWETSGGSGWGADDGGVMGGGNMPDFGALFVDEAEDGGDEQSEGEGQWQKKNSTNGNGGGKNGRGGKKQKQNGNKQQNGNHNQQTNGGGSQNSQGGGSSYGNPFDDPPEQTPTGKLRPDGVWTEDDCEILEYLKNKYEENKWLHMQAGFYNWTGRMVIAQLIEQKFKDDGAD